ncbi:MAG: DUF4290 domain-containing protein [Chitinophagales bacterium]
MILNMEYNTQNEQLIFKEYGRNIQRLVKEAIEIEDRDKRNAFANAIIALMGQLHPHLRNIDEFRFKLWHQLYILSDFKLDIDGPYPKPTREEVRLKTGDMPYPQHRIKHKHYGRNIENLVAKAIKMEDPDKQLAMAKVIANYMRMVYKSWSNESINEEIIKNDLRILSDGVLNIEQNDHISLPKSSRKRKKNTSSSRRKSSHHSSQNNHKKRKSR